MTCVQIAEGLYTKGYISYPRTETDQFDREFDFHELIQKHVNDANWGAFATGCARLVVSMPHVLDSDAQPRQRRLRTTAQREEE
jgi:DNA topoisomerase IA